MTVATTNNKIIYPGNASTTSFPFAFATPAVPSDIQVIYTDSSGNVTTLINGPGTSQYQLVINTPISPDPTPVGGTVTYNPSGSPIPFGSSLTIIRVLAVAQNTSLANQETLYPTAIEQALDYEMMVTQQVLEVQDRAFTVPVSDPIPLPVPPVAIRAGFGAGFDASGNLVPISLAPAGVISSAMTAVVGASTRALALALLGGWPVYNVIGSGADNTGAADCTGIVNALITTVQGATPPGGIILFPPGTYKFTGTIQIVGSGVQLIGCGRNATFFNFANTTLDCVTVQGTNQGAGQLEGFVWRDMTVNHTSKTAGRTLFTNFTAYCTVSNIVFNNVWTGLEILNNNTFNLEDLVLQGVTGGSGAYGIYWHAPATGAPTSVALCISNVLVNALYSGADGLIWDGYATTLNAYLLTFLGCHYGMHVMNSAASTSFYPDFGTFDNYVTDGMSAIGTKIDAGASIYFSNSLLGNTTGAAGQGNADTNALQINPDAGLSQTRDLRFTNCRIGLSRQTAALVNAFDVVFTSCTFESGTTTPSNTYSAIEIVGPSQDIIIAACKSESFGESNTWSYGCQVDAGTFRVMVVGNNFTQTLTNGVKWSNNDLASRSGLNSSFQANQSYDPMPLINPQNSTSGSGITMIAIDVVEGVFTRSGPGSPFTDTMPTAAQLVAQLVSPGYFKACPWMVINASAVVMTISNNTGVSFAGNTATATTFTIPANTTRNFNVHFTNTVVGSEAVTVYG
jgi:hypothetical protein